MANYYSALFKEPGTVLESLPLIDVEYTRRLGGGTVGDFKAKLPLGQGATSSWFGPTLDRAGMLLDGTKPWICAIYAETDDGQLRWGGPIVTRPYRSGQGYVELGAIDPHGYWQRRILPTSVNFSGASVDLFEMQRDAIGQGQQSLNRVRCYTDPAPMSGVTTTDAFSRDQFTPIEQIMQSVANRQGGIDYVWQPIIAADGNPAFLLLQGYPILGAALDDIELAYPGDITGYSYPEDAGNMATQSTAVGQQNQTTGVTPSEVAFDLSLAYFGPYPILERVESYTDVTVTATLQAHAAADLQQVKGPTTVTPLDMTLETLYETGLALGNVVHLTIDDPIRFPTGLDQRLRVVAITERPDAGTATIEVADRILTGGIVPSKPSFVKGLGDVKSRMIKVETI